MKKYPELIIFAKAPLPGVSKTRLARETTPEFAARVSAIMTEHIVRTATDCWQGSVTLHVLEEVNHPYFIDLSKCYPITIQKQGRGNLGVKMSTAVHGALDRGYSACIVGSDIPQCSGKILEAANQALQKGEAVLGPSADGGYYLIGLSRPCESLFINIPWSTTQVWQVTLEEAKRIKYNFTLLPELMDVDRWEDLVTESRGIPELGQLIKEFKQNRN